MADVHVARVDVDADDEIGEVARAFDSIAAACARLVRDQVELRVSMNSGFINLARRNQLCAERILRALDEWEQDELDTDRLQKLFVIDHLATRMRRTDDSLMVIAGAQTITKRTGPRSLDDVVGAALSEVEHYTRVVRRVAGDDVSSWSGTRCRTSCTCCRELLDNATTFSPPSSQVTVAFMRTPTHPGAVVVLIRDHGVGLSPERIAGAEPADHLAGGDRRLDGAQHGADRGRPARRAAPHRGAARPHRRRRRHRDRRAAAERAGRRAAAQDWQRMPQTAPATRVDQRRPQTQSPNWYAVPPARAAAARAAAGQRPVPPHLTSGYPTRPDRHRGDRDRSCRAGR